MFALAHPTAQDLSSLAVLFLAAWPALGSKTPFSRADVERVAALGAQLLEALGRQPRQTDGSDEPSDLEVHYVKAYELFHRAYEACRRAIIYLRYDEGDANVIAPPLGPAAIERARAGWAGSPIPESKAPSVVAEDDGGRGASGVTRGREHGGQRDDA